MSGAARADWIAAEHRRLGKYELIRRLATGGMAEIYLARAAAIEGFEKLVVLKRILPQHADNESFIRMFLAEARLAATLHHPNIVQVYDIGETDGTYFFAMEFVQGLDLRQLYNDGRRAAHPLPLQHILHIITGVCAGLHYAHEKKDPGGTPLGIVHRDISPSNVLVTFDGVVKVVDFGIAKAANVSTTAGTLKGKIPYMSPEQCRSEPIDRRSDVYSIGTLLWELTVGRKLFQADNEIALLGVVAKGEVTPPSAVIPEYPPALEAVVLKALEADVDARWQTAQQLQLALEDFAHEAGLPMSSARLQPYLAEVCAERIAKLEAQLAAQHDGGPGEVPDDDDGLDERTALYGTGEQPAGTPGPTPPVAEPTVPGGASVPEATAAPVTSVAIEPAVEEPPPTRRSPALMMGLVAGVLTLGAGAWWLSSSRERPAPEPAATPSAAGSQPSASEPAQAPPKAPAPDPTPAAPEEPEPPPPEAEPDAPPSEVAPEPPTEPPPQTAPSRRTKRNRRSTSRQPSGKSNEPAPTKESKPKWDPKAAPPPGL